LEQFPWFPLFLEESLYTPLVFFFWWIRLVGSTKAGEESALWSLVGGFIFLPGFPGFSNFSGDIFHVFLLLTWFSMSLTGSGYSVFSLRLSGLSFVD
jgi:hypothetical protein